MKALERADRLCATLIASPSELHSTGQHVPPQSPVTDKAEPRVFKRGRLIVLEEEVADPGAGVTLHERYGNEPPHLCDDRGDEHCGGNAGTGEMQSPASPVGVFAKIKGIEIGEGAK